MDDIDSQQFQRQSTVQQATPSLHTPFSATPTFNQVTPHFIQRPTELQELKKLARFTLNKEDKRFRLVGYLKYKTVYHVLKSFQKKFLVHLLEMQPPQVLEKQPKKLSALIANRELRNLQEVGQVLQVFVEDLTQEKSFASYQWQVEQVFFKFQVNLSTAIRKSKWHLNYLKQHKNVHLSFHPDWSKVENPSDFQVEIPIQDRNSADQLVDINKKFDLITKKFEEKTRTLMYKSDDSKLRMQGISGIIQHDTFQDKIATLKNIQSNPDVNSQVSFKFKNNNHNSKREKGLISQLMRKKEVKSERNIHAESESLLNDNAITASNSQDLNQKQANQINESQGSMSDQIIRGSKNHNQNFNLSKLIKLHKHNISVVKLYKPNYTIQKCEKVIQNPILIGNIKIKEFIFKIPCDLKIIKFQQSYDKSIKQQSDLIDQVQSNGSNFYSLNKEASNEIFLNYCQKVEDLLIINLKGENIGQLKVFCFCNDINAYAVDQNTIEEY